MKYLCKPMRIFCDILDVFGNFFSGFRRFLDVVFLAFKNFHKEIVNSRLITQLMEVHFCAFAQTGQRDETGLTFH